MKAVNSRCTQSPQSPPKGEVTNDIVCKALLPISSISQILESAICPTNSLDLSFDNFLNQRILELSLHCVIMEVFQFDIYLELEPLTLH